MTMAVPETGEIICGQAFHECICGREPGHEPPHRCSRASVLLPAGKCLGEWHDDGFIVTYPTGEKTEDAAVATLLGIIGTPIARIRRGGTRY